MISVDPAGLGGARLFSYPNTNTMYHLRIDGRKIRDDQGKVIYFPSWEAAHTYRAERDLPAEIFPADGALTPDQITASRWERTYGPAIRKVRAWLSR